MQVCNPTTPAQLFHLLRRQIVRKWRKPLIVMTPKSLLRHPKCVSTLEDLSPGTAEAPRRFRRVLTDSEVGPGQAKRILLCSGKVYYDLLARREQLGRNDVAILRLEQLYPFPVDELAAALEPQAAAPLDHEPRGPAHQRQPRHRQQSRPRHRAREADDPGLRRRQAPLTCPHAPRCIDLLIHRLPPGTFTPSHAMPTDLIVPQVGESITEVQIGPWHKQPGEAVKKDEVLVEIETDKVTQELYAPADGVIAAIGMPEGETAAVGAAWRRPRPQRPRRRVQTPVTTAAATAGR